MSSVERMARLVAGLVLATLVLALQLVEQAKHQRLFRALKVAFRKFAMIHKVEKHQIYAPKKARS